MKSFLRAEDIYSALWPLHVMSRIFALAPYSLKPESECRIKRMVTTCMCRIWSIIWIISLVAAECISISNVITANYTIKQKTVEILFYSSGYTYSIISLFLILTINHDKVPQILEKLSEIDQLFSTKKYGCQIYKNTPLFIIVQLSVLISTLSALFSFGMYINRLDFSFGIITNIFFEKLSVFINSIAILNFVNLVLLLRNKYKYLNSILETSALTPCKVTKLKYRNMYCITPIENSTFETKTSITEVRDNFMSSRRQHLRNLRIIYSQLHDVAVLINSTYALSLLCATYWVLITIISGANYAIDLKGTDHLYVLDAVLWSIFSMSLMTVMAVSCSVAVNECSRSPVIVQKIMLRDDISEEDMKDLDKMFTQFQAMKIGFSACGMYRIDLSLLCGVFGATLSYILIVPQL
jgi:hypothetical protein